MLSAPPDLYAVVAWFGGFILTQDRAILLGLSLHLHSEGAFRSSDSNGELSSARTPGIADEARLVPGQDTMFDSRSVNTNLARIWS